MLWSFVCFLHRLNTIQLFCDLLKLLKRKREREKRKITFKVFGSVSLKVNYCNRKVRLFHFLFEMLEDPSMAHCLSWVPSATGVFRFSSRNKDQVAALWGQKKGNKRPMTYQKMSRALRNYARSGEIFKVKKKLTYQFEKCVYGHLVKKLI
uniref:Transcription factor Spi-C n=1 Tax=Oryzias latipes TaxID=8090 RepID=A0A3P9M6D0_ORYLA